MKLKLPSPYQIKKVLMYPRALYMRRKERFQPAFILGMLELHYYRPAFYKWLGARSQDEHILHTANIDSGSIVLDVGAYTGEWAEEIEKRYAPNIYAFEPEPRNYRKLEKRAGSFSRLSIYKYGIGDSNETVRMSLAHMGSTNFGDIHGEKGIDWDEAQIKDVATAWQELGLETVHLMKINIEGAEYPMLERMIDVGLLDKVDTYLIQFHEWHPGAYHRRWKIRKALRKTHQLEWDYHFVWEKWVRK